MMNRLPVVLATAVALAAAAPASATFPGTNGRLVFERPIGKQVDVFTIRPDGGGLKRILGAPVIEEEAQWSADGSRIAFARSAKGGYPTEVWTADANGGALRRLTRHKDIATSPAWTPDSRIVYFTTKDFPPPSSPDKPPPPSELYSMSADGTDQRRLTNDRVIQVDPAVSPADGRVVFTQFQAVKGQPGVFDLGLLSFAADGSDVRTVAPFSALRDAFVPSWSPDGRQIVFEIISASPHGRGGFGRQSDLAVLDVASGAVRRLTRTAASETNPAWSPDGQLIAFTSDRHKLRGRLERHGPDFELYVMRADGSAIRRITRNKVPDLRPDWQALPG
ncbi:hypothetical protein BH20ACT16_BH20ACT16_12670 [soil metagenome]|jgi:TolB protein